MRRAFDEMRTIAVALAPALSSLASAAHATDINGVRAPCAAAQPQPHQLVSHVYLIRYSSRKRITEYA